MSILKSKITDYFKSRSCLHKAEMACTANQFNEATKYVNEAIDLNPKNAKAYLVRGMIKTDNLTNAEKFVNNSDECHDDFMMFAKLKPGDEVGIELAAQVIKCRSKTDPHIHTLVKAMLEWED